jgi:glyoxylase-like metal-dependent hydrolase (beta-lactamase superfamily II)
MSATLSVWHSVRKSVVAFLAVGMVMPAIAAAPMVKRASPGYFRVLVGDFELTALYDGGGEIDAKLLHAKPGDVQSLVRKELVDPEHIHGAVMGFLVNTGSKLILVDAGAGGHWGGPTLGKLVANLRLSGYRPEQVDLVLLTHLHADHVGGIYTATGSRTFPNAVVRMATSDSDFWLSTEVAKEAQEFFQIAGNAAAPYRSAGKWKPLDGSEEIVRGVRGRPIPGHTPGHTGYEFTSNGQTLLVWGDVVHVPAVQLPRPDIGIAYDIDGPSAIKAREQLFEELAAKGTLIAGAHMQFPSLGRLRKDAVGYAWVPVLYRDLP